MKDPVRKQVIDLLHPRLEKLGLTVNDLDTTESLLAQGVLDSMSFLEFIVELEETFNIEFDFSELSPSEFTSIDNLVKLIENGN